MKRWLIFLIAMLIALQSMQVIADVHTFFQSGTKFLEFNHDHAPSDVVDENTADKLTQSIIDCHSGGHCHCHIYLYLGAYQYPFFTGLPVLETVTYRFSFQSHTPASLFRPPIA